MLFLPASQGKPSRMQGCWVTEEEIASVVTFCRTQREPVFEEAVAATVSAGNGHREANGPRGEDEGDAALLRRAADQVVTSGLGSTSMLQRKLRIGFARAGRLMDELEEVGCVGPSEGSKAREVPWDEERLRAALEAGLL
jgi:S-DNA-T family DNA segregation ATPase FtsK/SpoIIIE